MQWLYLLIAKRQMRVAAIGTSEDRRQEVIARFAKLGATDAGGKALTELLKHRDFRVRILALRALTPIGKYYAQAAIRDAFRDPHPDVRVAAHGAGGKNPDFVESFVERLKRSKGKPDEYVEGTLVSLGAPAVPQLCNALHYWDNQAGYDVVKRVISILGQIRDTRAVDPLIQQLQAGGETGRCAAVALGAMGDKRAIEPLIQQLLRPVSSEIAKALESLGWIPETSEQRAYFEVGCGRYRRAAEEGVVAVRPLVAQLVGHADTREVEDALRYLGEALPVETSLDLGADDSDIQSWALSALDRWCRDPGAIDVLKRYLNQSRPNARGAIRLLERNGGDHAVKTLAHFVCHSGDSSLRWNALRALDSLKWTPSNSSERAWYAVWRRFDNTKELGRLATHADLTIAQMNRGPYKDVVAEGAAAVEPLMAWIGQYNWIHTHLLSSRTVYGYSEALNALVDIGDPRAVALLQDALKHADLHNDLVKPIVDTIAKLEES